MRSTVIVLAPSLLFFACSADGIDECSASRTPQLEAGLSSNFEKYVSGGQAYSWRLVQKGPEGTRALWGFAHNHSLLLLDEQLDGKIIDVSQSQYAAVSGSIRIMLEELVSYTEQSEEVMSSYQMCVFIDPPESLGGANSFRVYAGSERFASFWRKIEEL